MEGNTLIDCQREVRRGSRCSHCNGTGRKEWDMVAFTDALDLTAYKRKKHGKPVAGFKELMKIARELKAEGQECDKCDGTGEYYDY